MSAQSAVNASPGISTAAGRGRMLVSRCGENIDTEDKKMKIAITGGIGAGKSFVCKSLNRRGIEVYDCDAAAKRLMRTSP